MIESINLWVTPEERSEPLLRLGRVERRAFLVAGIELVAIAASEPHSVAKTAAQVEAFGSMLLIRSWDKAARSARYRQPPLTDIATASD